MTKVAEFGTDLENFVGQTFEFYGAHTNMFKLDDAIYEAVEDPDDGYRSYLGSIKLIPESGSPESFYRLPVARVILEEEDSDSLEGYKLIDAEDGHVWLVFGTDNADDYYPNFVFEYHPKTPA